jgi:hypothetical protein
MELQALAALQLFLGQDPVDGIIVRLEEPKGDLERLADVIFGSIGLSGVIGVIAIAIGIVVGGLLFWLRSRRESDEEGRFRL